VDPNDGSVVSSFKFISYKVDDFEFHMEKNFALLDNMDSLNPSMWDFNVMVRTPMFFQGRNQYLSGVKCLVSLKPDPDRNEFRPLELSATISGLFETEGRFSEDTEMALVKMQMPTILLPYLRGTITSFLANAGFGSVILPLINMVKLADNALRDISVNVIASQPVAEVSTIGKP
jgi:preprotein translocase subunit SecB